MVSFVEYCEWSHLWSIVNGLSMVNGLHLCYDKLSMCLVCAALHLMCKQDGTSCNGLLWVLGICSPCGLLHLWDNYFEMPQVIFCVK